MNQILTDKPPAFMTERSPIFDELIKEFIADGIKIKKIMARPSPTTDDLLRMSDATAKKARLAFLKAEQEDTMGDRRNERDGKPLYGDGGMITVCENIIPLVAPRDERGRFQKRLNG